MCDNLGVVTQNDSGMAFPGGREPMHPLHATRRALVGLLMCTCTMAPPAAARSSEVSPDQLRVLLDKLLTPTVDGGHHLAADGRSVRSADLEVTFADGTFHPLVRADGKRIGVAFVGGAGESSARLTFAPPDVHEQEQLSRFLGEAPYEAGFSAAWIRASDDTLDQLVGDAEWIEGDAGAPSRARTVHQLRQELYRDPLWNDWGPALEMDVLEDLHGGGFAGGHLFAEFKVGPSEWVSYYRNPRGALFPTEDVALFSHVPKEDSPHNMHVYASYRTSDGPPPPAERPRPYNLARVDLDVTVPPGGIEHNLARVEVLASLQIQARADGLQGLTLDLQSRRRRVLGDQEWGEFRVRSVRDDSGRELAAVHDRNRLFVVLAEPLAAGEVVTLDVAYEGDLIEPLAGGDLANKYYTTFRRYPWYPSSPWPDLHAVGTTVHAPRFLRAVAPGELMQETEDDRVRTTVFEERRGIRRGSLALGDYLVTEDTEGDVPIRVYTIAENKQSAKDTASQVQALLAYFSALWGPYPYSTVNVVDRYPHGDDVARGTGYSWLYRWDRARRQDPAMLFVSYSSGGTPIRQVATDVATQWWGQRAAPASYREWWITDGLARFSETLAMRAFDSPNVYDRLMREWHANAAFAELGGNLLDAHRVERYYQPVSVGRSVAVLQMLMGQMGTETFVEAMRGMLQRAPNEGLTCNDFRKAVADRLGPEQADAFWTYWVEWDTLPSLGYSHAVVAADDGTFSVEGTLLFDGEPPPTPIPVTLHYPRNETEQTAILPTGSETPFVIDGLQRKPKKVEIDPDHLVLLRQRRALKGKR